MLYNKEQVLAFMPHRDPFLFIDSVKSIEVKDSELIDGEVIISMRNLEGAKVIANFFTRPDLEIFRGHFPGNPILPGVVQVEMMAQAACFVVTKLYSDPFNNDMEVALMGINSAKFRKPITPNMNLEIHAVCTKTRGPVMSFDCQIYCDGNIMSESSVLASVKL